MPCTLYAQMSCTIDDAVLSRLVQFCEVSHVTGYPHHQAFVFFRGLLRSPQCFIIYDIDLYVFAAFFEISLDHTFYDVQPLFSLDTLRIKSQVEQCSIMESAPRT